MQANKSIFVLTGRSALLLSFMLVGAADSIAAPILTVKSSTTQARKSEVFKVYLEIVAQEKIDNLEIILTPPSGFALILEKENEKAVPRTLEPGSSYTAVYTIMPPSWWRVYIPGGDPRERKLFVFNVAYTTTVDGAPRQFRQSVDLTVDFSIPPFLYLICGVLGAIIGNVIKTFTAERTTQPTTRAAFRSVFTDEVGGMLTSIAIAFVVLLVLSRDAIPTKGWYDSLALGAGVAILGDEQLLTKIKQIIPKG
jgi:hypothetical protein